MSSGPTAESLNFWSACLSSKSPSIFFTIVVAIVICGVPFVSRAVCYFDFVDVLHQQSCLHLSLKLMLSCWKQTKRSLKFSSIASHDIIIYIWKCTFLQNNNFRTELYLLESKMVTQYGIFRHNLLLSTSSADGIVSNMLQELLVFSFLFSNAKSHILDTPLK